MRKVLIIFGITIILIGLLWPLIQKLNIGKLPGDILIKKDNFTFYFPITTMIILSLIISFILKLFK